MTSSTEMEHEKSNTPAGGKSESENDAARVENTVDGSQNAGVDGAKPKKPSKLSAFWKGLGLDLLTVLTMAKGGLPPAIALALYQIDVVAAHFSTIGYLIAIISILGMSIMPRAKFMQTMISHLIFLCLAAAMALLVIYCSTQARLHTSTPETITLYNSSASAVSGLWLFFNVYLVNTTRARFPQLQLPVIMYSIFIIVSCTYSATFPTMTYGIAFIKQLLESFATGLAIATAVQFLVMPLTVRTIVFKEFAGYLGLLQKCLKAHQAYLASLEDPETLGQALRFETSGDMKRSPQAAMVTAMVNAIAGLHGKLQADVAFAKREVALGKMGPDEITSTNKHLRAIMLPTIGMTALGDLLEHIAAERGWSGTHLKEGLEESDAAFRETTIKEWSENIKALHDPFELVVSVCVEGLEHIMLQLQLKRPPKGSKKKTSTDVPGEDVEGMAEATKPGDKGFADYMQVKVDTFYGGKREVLESWCSRHGIELTSDFFDHPQDAKYAETEAALQENMATRQRGRRQLYLLLYMEFLFWSTAKGILAMVKYSDDLVASGKLSKTKLILPGWRRIKKWAKNFLNDESTNEESQELGDVNQTSAIVDLGSAFNLHKDPEHLAPTNVFERVGDGIRTVPRFLRSPASMFGFRVALATMTIAILAFLHQTQTWFTYHRIIWAMIMVAISMSPSSGQSVFSFVLRIFGTAVAMCLALLVWYIPDGHIPGVIVLLWIAVALGMYLPLKLPDFAVIGVISVVTTTLIIGYEVAATKIGIAAAASNGQEFLPIYLLGPYRLATVVAGLVVAFIFTIIPFPISEHSLLRQNVGGSLYLLANYYSVVHETIRARVGDFEGDPSDSKSLGARLTKLRTKVFTKQLLMLVNLRNYQKFLKWEIPIGGKFPKQQYDVILKSIDGVTRYISLLSYASQSLSAHVENPHSQWSQDLKELIGTTSTTSHEVTSLLALLSASMTSGQPLPPYLQPPTPYGLNTKLEAMDPDILSVRHIDEPEYATFAVLQIASRCVVYELEILLRNVKELVGELDFSFHVVSTANSSETRLGLEESKEDLKGLKRKGD